MTEFSFGAMLPPTAAPAVPAPPAPGLVAAGPFVALLDEQVTVVQCPSLLDYAYPEPTTVMLHVVEEKLGQYGADFSCVIIPVSRPITGSVDRTTGTITAWRPSEHVRQGEQRPVFIGGANRETARGIEARQLTAGVRWTCVRVAQSGKARMGARLVAPTADEIAEATEIAGRFEPVAWRV